MFARTRRGAVLSFARLRYSRRCFSSRPSDGEVLAQLHCSAGHVYCAFLTRLLLCPRMLEHEAIVITGAEQFSRYTGYGSDSAQQIHVVECCH